MQLQTEVERLRPFETDALEKNRQIDNLIHQNNELLNAMNDPHNMEIYDQLQTLTEEVGKVPLIERKVPNP